MIVSPNMAGAPVTDVFLVGGGKNDGDDGLDTSPANLVATPPSRAWMAVWAFLTWAMTIAFSILVITAFTADISDYPNGPTYKRADLFPKAMGVSSKFFQDPFMNLT